MKPINSEENKNQNVTEVNNTDDSKLVNISSNSISFEDVKNLREEANRLLDDKINKGVIDAQAFSIVQEWLDALYSIEEALGAKESIIESYNAIEKDAEAHARHQVYLLRKQREKKIEEEYEKNQNKLQSGDDLTVDSRIDMIRYAKEAKRKRKRLKADKKVRKAQASFIVVDEENKRRDLSASQETKEKLEEIKQEDAKAEHEYNELKRDISQREREAELKRAQSNAKMENNLKQDETDWKIKKEKQQQARDLEKEQLQAEHDVIIAKSKRQYEEQMNAISEAQLNLEREKEKLNNKSTYDNSYVYDNLNLIKELSENYKDTISKIETVEGLSNFIDDAQQISSTADNILKHFAELRDEEKVKVITNVYKPNIKKALTLAKRKRTKISKKQN